MDLLLAMGLTLALCSAPGSQKGMYVSPWGEDGNDGGPGTPVRTLAAAFAHLASTGGKDGGSGCTVSLAPGTYRIEQSLRIEKGMGGEADRPLLIRAQAGGEVRVVGGIRLAPAEFHPLEDPAVLARLPGSAARGAVRRLDLRACGLEAIEPIEPRGFPQPIHPAPPELFVNGAPMTIARWPNEGFAQVGEVLAPTPDGLPAFRFPSERLSRWAAAPNPWVYGYWRYDWADESLPVARIDPAAHTITLARAHTYGLAKGQPFRVENLLEELDAPGEYFIDRAGSVLYFWPPAPLARSEIWLSTQKKPLVIALGAGHVRFVGLTFAYTRGDAVLIEDSNDVTFEHCVFQDIGDRAVVIRGGSRDEVVSCTIANTGEGGISVSGGERATLTPCGHAVIDCDIGNFSRRVATYRPALRVGGVGVRIAHNDLHDAPHSAIIFGGNDHSIEYNEIHHVLSRTGDGGAIYCGRDWTLAGTRIQYNDFHDIRGLGKWENAVYIDDQASGITVRGNLFESCHWGLLVGGGRNNVIEGNLFVNCSLALHMDARGLGWAARMAPTLRERLAAVPFESGVWKERFGWLSTLLDDGPMAPEGNVFGDNLLVHSGKALDDVAAPARSHGTFTGNVVRAEPSGLVERVRGHATLDRDLLRAIAPDFTPPPVERMGRRRKASGEQGTEKDGK